MSEETWKEILQQKLERRYFTRNLRGDNLAETLKRRYFSIDTWEQIL